MHEATLVGQRAICPNQHVSRNCLSKDLNAQHVRDDLLCFPVQICMSQPDIIVAADNIAESGEALLDALDNHRVRQRVADVEHLLVRRGGRQQEPLAVADTQATDDAVSGDACVDDGDVVRQLGLKYAVEIFAAAHANNTVGIREPRKHPDLIVVLKLCSRRHPPMRVPFARVLWIPLGKQYKLSLDLAI